MGIYTDDKMVVDVVYLACKLNFSFSPAGCLGILAPTIVNRWHTPKSLTVP